MSLHSISSNYSFICFARNLLQNVIKKYYNRARDITSGEVLIEKNTFLYMLNKRKTFVHDC